MTPNDMNESPTTIFRALAAPQRLAIFRRLLHTSQSLCSSELAEAFGLPLYAMSRHLKMLQAAGLVAERRDGRHVYYTARHDSSVFMQQVCSAVHELEPSAPYTEPTLEVAHV